ncbi:MAG: hypothetical protein M1820_004737 [Bogoriella megaspora]|nr:MAG: hypothetical protein M1820_004737 [Bogoriella megaspora]
MFPEQSQPSRLPPGSSQGTEIDVHPGIRVVPGANSWAIRQQEHEARVERHRFDSNSWFQKNRSVAGLPTSRKTRPTGLRIRDTNILPENSPAMATMSNLVTSGTSHSVSPFDENLKLVPDECEDAKPTDRASIEAKSEVHLQQVIAENPTTPVQEEMPVDADKSATSKSNVRFYKLDRPKSPVKQFFDKYLPTFTKSSPEIPRPPTMIPTMADAFPPKAAQIFGTSKPDQPKAREELTPIKKAAKKAVASVPARFGGKAHGGGAIVPLDPADIASEASRKINSQYGSLSNYPSAPLARPRSQSFHALEEKCSDDHPRKPPPVPAKNTPPTKLTIKIPTKQSAPIEQSDPNTKSAKSTASGNGTLVDAKGLSPVRGGGFAVKERVAAVEKVPSMYSLRAALDIAGDEDDRNLGGKSVFGSRWSEGEKERVWEEQGLLPGGHLPASTYPSPANHYSPSIYSAHPTPRPDSGTLPKTRATAVDRGLPPCILPPAPHTRNFSNNTQNKPASVKTSQGTLPVVFCGSAKEISPELDSAEFVGLGITSQDEPSSATPTRASSGKGDEVTPRSKRDTDMNRARSKSGPSVPSTDTASSEKLGVPRDDSLTNIANGIEKLHVKAPKSGHRLFSDLPSVPSTVRSNHVSATPAETFPGFDLPSFTPPSDVFLEVSPTNFAVSGYPSAMPTPLYGREGSDGNPPEHLNNAFPAVPFSATLPDGTHILTHFDVIHHHIEDIATKLSAAVGTSRDSLIDTISRKLCELTKEGETHYGDLREQLNTTNHNVGRMTADVESLTKSIADLSNAVKGTLASSVSDLAKANQNLTKQVQSLEKRLNETRDKFDSLQATTAAGAGIGGGQGASGAMQQGSMVVPTPHYVGPLTAQGYPQYTPAHQPIYVQSAQSLPQPPNGQVQYTRQDARSYARPHGRHGRDGERGGFGESPYMNQTRNAMAGGQDMGGYVNGGFGMQAGAGAGTGGYQGGGDEGFGYGS